MRTIALLTLLLFICGTPESHQWAGQVAIGSDLYSVTAETTASGVVHFALRLSPASGGPPRTIVAVLGPTSAEVSIDGAKPRQLSQELAAGWRRELSAGFRPSSLTEFECKETATERVCDSRMLMKLDEDLAGRMRFIYRRGQLVGIRFFSLAEWTNPFQVYVALSLDLQEEAKF